MIPDLATAIDCVWQSVDGAFTGNTCDVTLYWIPTAYLILWGQTAIVVFIISVVLALPIAGVMVNWFLRKLIGAASTK